MDFSLWLISSIPCDFFYRITYGHSRFISQWRAFSFIIQQLELLLLIIYFHYYYFLRTLTFVININMRVIINFFLEYVYYISYIWVYK